MLFRFNKKQNEKASWQRRFYLEIGSAPFTTLGARGPFSGRPYLMYYVLDRIDRVLMNWLNLSEIVTYLNGKVFLEYFLENWFHERITFTSWEWKLQMKVVLIGSTENAVVR